MTHLDLVPYSEDWLGIADLSCSGQSSSLMCFNDVFYLLFVLDITVFVLLMRNAIVYP